MTYFGVSCLLINVYGVTYKPKWAGRIYYVHLFVDIYM